MKTYTMVFLFATAMAFLESAVVVYLRYLLYPNGFGFPLQPMPVTIAITEAIREAATIVMLACAGYLAGKNVKTRFAWFIYAFAVWDIFYYVFLKAIINWPAGMLVWDVLFLLPVMWSGPVYAPVIISLLMIWLAVLILESEFTFSTKSGSLMISGCLLCLFAFMSEFWFYHVAESTNKWSVSQIAKSTETFVPQNFPIVYFFIGVLLIAFPLMLSTFKTTKLFNK